MTKTLLIEDNRICQSFGKLLIESLGDRVITADTGSQAIKLLKDNLFDIIITDFNLPDIDGYYILDYIMKTTPSPIIVLSADAQQIDLSKITRKNIKVAPKPLTEEMYTEMLNLCKPKNTT